jgi:hypothetical protein
VVSFKQQFSRPFESHVLGFNGALLLQVASCSIATIVGRYGMPVRASYNRVMVASTSHYLPKYRKKFFFRVAHLSKHPVSSSLFSRHSFH